MQPYNVEIFDRNLNYVYNTFIEIDTLDDDYLSSVVNDIEVPLTHDVKTGYFIRLYNDIFSYFGVVCEVDPGEFLTDIRFKPFITIFDEDVLFNVNLQYSSSSAHKTLEEMLRSFISDYYISDSDTIQRLPITISIDSSITQTNTWSFGIEPDTEEGEYAIVKLYSDLIVNALAMYGVAIDVEPIFSTKTIKLTITKRQEVFKISADLENVKIKSLKYDNNAKGTNKLIVYNSDNWNMYIIFYVHTDSTWDAEDTNRITPVIREMRSVAPDRDIEDATEAFAASALDVAYGTLSGQAYDNLIELITYPNDENIMPQNLGIGQKVSVWYKGAMYTSILTGKIYDRGSITLIFGSQRIEYSKRR